MKWLDRIRSHYETLLYAGALGLMLLALLKPEVQLKQEVHNYFMLADVSQSMNAEDMKIGTKVTSRMAYTKHLMKRVVEGSPCGTYFSVGVFAAENVAMLFMPLEVCANYDIITDTIDQLEWRMAWRGNSRLSFGVKAASTVLDALNTPAQMLFFTDGDEAPKVNAINKLDLTGLPGGENWTLIGIGGHEAVPIPRYNGENTWVGFWPGDAKEVTAGAVGVTYSDTAQDEPDPIVAYAEYDRYLSQQEDGYLKELAGEIKGKYLEGTDTPAFYDYIQKQKPAASFVTSYNMRWLYLALAALLIVLAYLPDLRYKLDEWRARKLRPVAVKRN
ncbi:MAG TPA: vWA domain-containing protein [Methylophilaceae bacterium]|nr:vWA domain-containing protein [Methylophilaceae bacterium]